MRAVFPRSEGDAFTVILTNTSGGVTGGDRFKVEATAETGATLTLSTQTAERAYLAQPGETARIDTLLRAEAGARINWLPQETILFLGCSVERRLTVDLQDAATALIVEPLVLGRAAMGEVLTQAKFHDRIEVRRSGQLAYLDQMKLDTDVANLLAGPAIGDGAGAIATVLFVHPAAEAMIEPVRAMLPETGGASLVQPSLIAVRLVALDSFLLRQSLVPIIDLLNTDDLPRPWMI